MEQQHSLDLPEAFFHAARRFLRDSAGHQGALAAARRFLENQGFDLGQLDRLPAGFCPDCATMKDSLGHAGFTAAQVDASELVADPRLTERLLGSIRDLRGSIRGVWARHPLGKRPQYLFKGKWKDEVPALGLNVAFPALENGRLPLSWSRARWMPSSCSSTISFTQPPSAEMPAS